MLAIEIWLKLGFEIEQQNEAMTTTVQKGKETIIGTAFATDEQRWAAVRARNPLADGAFVYAVKTTGVYCRPSSSARRPKRENVEFFNTAKAA